MDPENVRLAAPGAGLPFLEYLVSRYYWFPKFCKSTTWDQAHALFQKQGARLLAIARELPEGQRTIRVLIPRVPGIEDSSRHWSVAMVLEHLMIVGKLMGEGIVELTHGRIPDWDISTADVKPRGGLEGSVVIADYEKFLKRFEQQVMTEAGDRASGARLKHPWFGRLNAHQWLCLAGAHQKVHRVQGERIRKNLPQPPP
ncbi:MAG TPA: hypothetical protein VFX30_04055 [bacterium]|nr:hypothetical protein [bacterium]